MRQGALPIRSHSRGSVYGQDPTNQKSFERDHLFSLSSTNPVKVVTAPGDTTYQQDNMAPRYLDFNHQTNISPNAASSAFF